MFTQPMLLACLALAAALLLVFRHRPIAFPVAALLVSALEVLSAFGLVRLTIARVPIALLFGAALVVAGVAVFARAVDKGSIAAATTVALVGALQALAALHLHG